MRSDQLARVTELFGEALGLAAEEREAFLDRACGEDPPLRDELASLLAAHAEENGRFAAPPADLLSELAGDAVAAAPGAGQMIGPYRIVREIGHGGMGAVYEAYRADDDYRKRVAIKTLAVGRGHASLLQRFRQERRILARLDHRHIAALLDGGVTPEGFPFYAMEYVEGEAIDAYCRARALPLRDRVHLLRQVCGAVHYAHRNLVVHRDLKPGNILVTTDGTVKLLDVGIAKLLAAEDDTTGEDMTDAGGAPFTPAYASPEQVRGEPVTTATDLHALGVVLYLVLAGRHPYRDGDTSAGELRRRVLEQAPPPTGLGPELDAIVRMALHKDPGRRYGSAEQLAEDLGRWLRGEPVLAHPDTVGYRVTSFVRRHRVGVAAAAAIVVLLVAGALATAWQARRAEAERRRAEEFARFTAEILAAPDPLQRGPDARVIDILGDAAGRARVQLAGQPAALASILRIIGETYSRLLVLDSAQPLLREAVETPRAALGDGHAETARSRAALGRVVALTDTSDLGERLLEEGIAVLARTPRAAPDLVVAQLEFGNVLWRRGKLDRAEPVLLEALAGARRLHGERDLTVAAALQALAVLADHRGDRVGAKARFREAVGLLRSLGGPGRGNLALALYDLSNVLKLEDSLAAAEAMVTESLGLMTAIYGSSNVGVGTVRTNLGDIRRRQGRVAEAEAELAEAVRILRGSLPEGHSDLAASLSLLGLVRCERGAPRLGEPLLREALEIRYRSLPPGHWLTHNLESGLVVCLTALGRFAEAESVGVRGYEGLRDRLGPAHPRTREAAARLVALYDRWDRPDRAAVYREE
jgi:tetratricopeptide (TPR) repeat protein